MRKIWEQMTKADSWETRNVEWLQRQQRKRIANRPAAKDARYVVNRMRKGLTVPDRSVRDQRRIDAQERKRQEREAFSTLRQLGMI
jgi:hypothetical protein